MKYLNQLITEWIGDNRKRFVTFYRHTDSAIGCRVMHQGNEYEGFGEEPRTAFVAAIEEFELKDEFDPGPCCDDKCIKNHECRGHTLQVID